MTALNARSHIIDIWNVATFDEELVHVLERDAAIVRNYHSEERNIVESYDLADRKDKPLERPPNRHFQEFTVFEESVSEIIRSRTVRGFHYTRLTDAEVSRLLERGIEISTAQSLRARLDGLLASGTLEGTDAESIWATSPLNGCRPESRSGKFWMVSHPQPTDDDGVQPLLSNWGGEVAYMRLQDERLRARVAQIGVPRILEVAAPVEITGRAPQVATAVIRAFARSHGAPTEKSAFDFFVVRNLPPAALLALHTHDDRDFVAMGRGYPESFPY